MKRANLTVNSREDSGKGVARKLRQAGRIPGVLYGPDSEPEKISIDRRSIALLIEGEGKGNTILNLDIEGREKSEEILALPKEVQHHPITDELLHVDLLRISLDRAITTTVPIHLEGTPVGVKSGGVLEQQLRNLEIHCLPTDIPEIIGVLVENLDIGDTLHVSDLTVPAGVTVLTPEKTTIAVVESPAKLAAAQAVPEPEEAEAEGEGEGEEAAAEGEEAEGAEEGKEQESEKSEE
jgi:large subunit ribosomal protein L25